MSEKHLVSCPCGAQQPVEFRNAGEVIRCDCGQTIQVPTLREIRQLPLAAADVAIQPHNGWTLGFGLTYAVTLPLLLACLGFWGRTQYLRWNLTQGALTAPTLRDVLEQHPDPLIHIDIDSMKPWQTVKDVWQPFQAISHLVRFTPRHVQAKELDRRYQYLSLFTGLGAAVSGVVIVGTLLLARSRTTVVRRR